jgi:hypothetical protein
MMPDDMSSDRPPSSGRSLSAPSSFRDRLVAFTIEFIPSFVHHNNTLEKLVAGSANFMIIFDLVQTLVVGPWTVSTSELPCNFE